MSLDFWLEKEVTEMQQVFSSNATHNLTPMWRAAGVYEALYRSEGKKAAEIIPALVAGLAMMLDERERFEAMNPENGWGDYDGAVKFLYRVLAACKKHHTAIIGVWA